MADSGALVERAWAKIDPVALEQLLIDLINALGSTGFEKPAAELVARYAAEAGLETLVQDFDEGRANGIGIIRGAGGGPSLQYFGHLDTSYTGFEREDFALAGPMGPALRPQAFVEGDWIFGQGAFNMKAGVAAQFEAACAIQRAGIALKGDLVVAGVAGESEKMQLDGLFQKYRGPKYRGAGEGIRYLWTHGYVADFAISPEPTAMSVQRFHCGFVWLRLITRGRPTYSGVRGARYSDHALLKMAKVVQAIEEEFGPAYSERHTMEYQLGADDERPVPSVNVGAIEAGCPFRPSMAPAIAYAYLDLRTVPGHSPLEAIGELREFLQDCERRSGIVVELEPLFTKSPVLATHPDAYVVGAAKRAYELVRGEGHKPRRDGNCAANDTFVTLQFGCPSITWGPNSPLHETPYPYGTGEGVRKSDLLEATKMFVAATLDVCLQDRSSAIASPERKFEALTAEQVL